MAEERVDFASIVVTGAYPVLDLTLIIPSYTVLFKLRKNYYVTDFIIMAGALFWYNRYHITTSIKLQP